MFDSHYSGALVGLTWGLLWIAFILVMTVVRSRERSRTLDIIDKAIQAGQPVPPELMSRWDRRWRGPGSDLRRGLIFMAIGVGLAIGGWVNFVTYTGPHPRLFYGVYGLFPVPLLVGVAFLVMAAVKRGADR